jgi:predicted ABC-type ATPase
MTRKKERVIISGAGGTGKTTFAYSFLRSYNQVYLNGDRVTKSLSAENPKAKKLSAGRNFFKALHDVID